MASEAFLLLLMLLMLLMMFYLLNDLTLLHCVLVVLLLQSAHSCIVAIANLYVSLMVGIVFALVIPPGERTTVNVGGCALCFHSHVPTHPASPTSW